MLDSLTRKERNKVLLLILCYAPNYRVVAACRGHEDNAVHILGLGIVFIADVILSNRRFHLSFPLKKVIPVEDLVLEYDTVCWVSEQSAVTISSLKRAIAASLKIFMYVKKCNVRHQNSFLFSYFYLANACCIFLPSTTTNFRSLVYIYFLSLLHFSLYLFIRSLNLLLFLVCISACLL